MEAAKNNDINFFFDSSGRQPQSYDLRGRKIGGWVGPEGGWSKDEIRAAREAGFEIVNLGKLTLRAETAAIVASFEILNGL